MYFVKNISVKEENMHQIGLVILIKKKWKVNENENENNNEDDR